MCAIIWSYFTSTLFHSNFIDENIWHTHSFSTPPPQWKHCFFVLFIQALSQPSCTYMTSFYIPLLFSKHVSLVAAKKQTVFKHADHYIATQHTCLVQHLPPLPDKHKFLLVCTWGFSKVLFPTPEWGSTWIYKGFACLQMLADFTLFAQGSFEWGNVSTS